MATSSVPCKYSVGCVMPFAPGGNLFGGPIGGAETGQIELPPAVVEHRLEMRRLTDVAFS